jgi:mannitol-1-/sugar-/sorbitol-6-/2-deoxyglucose-6-phosphatase
MFRAAIFDMDGLLVDSEPCWRRAEREVFGSVGVDITDDMARVTAPMTTREVTLHWFRFRPWHGRSLDDVEAAVIARVGELIRTEWRAMPGVRPALALCGAMNWRVALASNSPAVLCDLVLGELGVTPAFHAVISADVVERGKPDPAIYLHAANSLGVAPHDCLVFEDSPGGVRAARAAGMSVVAIAADSRDFPADAPPHLTLASLAEFSRSHAELLWRRHGAPRGLSVTP